MVLKISETTFRGFSFNVNQNNDKARQQLWPLAAEAKKIKLSHSRVHSSLRTVLEKALVLVSGGIPRWQFC